MSKYLKQHCFTENNIDKYYLSPYVFIENDGENTFIGRQDREVMVGIQNNFGQGERFIEKLESGMNEEETLKACSEVLDVDSAEEALVSLIQGGLIE